MRGTEVLRCGAKRLPSTFVDEEQESGIALLFVREGGQWASAPHSIELQFHAIFLNSLKILKDVFRQGRIEIVGNNKLPGA